MQYKRKMVVSLLVGLFLFLGSGQALAEQYIVQPGDTLYLISRNFKTSVNSIMSSNGLTSTNIYPGQALYVPAPSGKYKVKSGDSLYTISRLFSTSVNNIKSMNGLKSANIYPGQVLNVPLYTVKHGDTLYLLSQKFGLSVASIKSLNGLTGNTIYPWQKLLINSGSGATATTGAHTASVTASRSGSSYSRSEVLLLARLINGESRGEPYEGQVAVGAVVLNRVKSPLFPNTISGVVYQRNEFSVVNDGQINLTPSTTAIKAAENAMSGWDPSNGALYYWNPVKSPNNRFLNSRPIVARIGNHVFAK
ncbi:MAG: LysM peptidoglycan-binding domain-containing protein [Bacillota bacterium]|jgi:N-acetylmuramoyl-L-alanine amidase|nr:LysM peptidoglycan-binding domain-containing protein [Clostridia bacterium]